MTTTSDRRRRASDALGDRAPALLVTASANVRYLTGFTGSNGQLLLAPDPVFFTDGRYDEQSGEQVPDVERQIYSASVKYTDVLRKTLDDRGISAIAIEADHVTLASGDRLRSGLDGIGFVRTQGLVERVREVKDADEIAEIARAQHIAERALLDCVRALDGGTELDLALAIEWAMRTTGAEDVSFETIVASGAHSALPHATPRAERIDTDGILLIDLGARAGGYCSDTTRTFLGKSGSDSMRRIHDCVVKALDAACAVVRPGVAASDVDAAARTSLEADGYGDAFIHSTGHGVGLEIHEGPSLTMSGEGTLEAGMVITVEPGVYLPGVGGVRVEDLLVVTHGGFDNLTSLPRGPELPA